MLVKPFSPRRDASHPINRRITGWWSSARSGTRIDNLLYPELAAPTFVGTGVSRADGRIGSTIDIDGLSYVDLGSAYPILPSDTTPFTFMWQERIPSNWNSSGLGGGALSGGDYRGLLNLFATGAASAWWAVRNDAATSGTGGGPYGAVSFGPSTTNSAGVAFVASALRLSNSVGLWRTWVFTNTIGTSADSVTTGNYNHAALVVDGISYAPAATGNFVSQTTARNHIGWDGLDNKFIGQLDNIRMWSRVLSKSEIDAIMVDPWIGARPKRAVFTGSVTVDPSFRRDAAYFLAL